MKKWMVALTVFAAVFSVQASLVVEFGQQGVGDGDGTDNTEYGITNASPYTLIGNGTFATKLSGDGTDTFTTGSLSNTNISFNLIISTSTGDIGDANEGIGPNAGANLNPGLTMTFALSDITGLSAGESLAFTGLTTWFATADDGANGEGYVIDGVATEVPLAATGNGYFVALSGDLASFTLGAQTFGAQTTQFQVHNLEVSVVPEPATIGMLGLGALITLLVRRFKRA